MSLWEFAAAIGGVAAANSDADDGLTREDAEAAGDLLDDFLRRRADG